MKVKVDLAQASRLVNCGMVILITSAYKDKRNVTTCAWHMPVSRNPAGVAIALAKKHFSSELIKKSEQFIINIPSWELLPEVVSCGSFTGWKGDKFKLTGLTPRKGHSLVNVPKIKECIGSMECSLFDIKEAGSHYVFFGEVVYAEAEAEYFAFNFWDTKKVDLIFHLGSKFFFKSGEFTVFEDEKRSI